MMEQKEGSDCTAENRNAQMDILNSWVGVSVLEIQRGHDFVQKVQKILLVIRSYLHIIITTIVLSKSLVQCNEDDDDFNFVSSNHSSFRR